MARKKKSVEDILKDINGYYEENIVIDDFDKMMKVIPTGSLALDVSIGVGGVPRGRMTEFYGSEMSGKTSLCLSLMRENSISGEGLSAFIDTENSLNTEYIKNVLGDHFREGDLYAQPKALEQVFELAEACIDSGRYSLIILDSIAQLASFDELDSSFDTNTVALVPRLINRFLKRNLFKIRDKDIAFVVTNQVRDTIGSYVNFYQTTGGHGLKHSLSVRVMLSKSSGIKEKTTDSDDIGHNVNFTIKKNKVGVPFRSATTNIIYGYGIDKERDVLSFGTLLGVIERHGSYYRFEGETLGGVSGVKGATDYLKENKEVLDKIIEMCYNVAQVERYPTKE